MSRLRDLTRCFKSTKVDWRLRGRAFGQQFEPKAQVLRGVYAHLNANSSPTPIYDKNHGGKIIVLPSTTALKFGKFVGGLPKRMLQNHDHFHRRPGRRAREHGIFPAVLTVLVVFSLEHRPRESVRSIETEWNRRIKAALRARDLIHAKHSGRGESINLRRRITRSELLAILRPIAQGIDSPRAKL